MLIKQFAHNSLFPAFLSLKIRDPLWGATAFPVRRGPLDSERATAGLLNETVRIATIQVFQGAYDG